MVPKKKIVEDPVKEYGEKEIRDNLIPMDEGDVTRSIEVHVKETPITETIEKVGMKKERIAIKKETKIVKKKSSKKVGKKTSMKSTGNWIDSFNIPGNKKLKEKGPIMIITEKPQSSVKISDALAQGKIEKRSIGGVNYYEFIRDGKPMVVVCAVGHLFTLAQVKQRNPWPTFDIKWAPNFLIRKKDFTKKYYEVIAKLSKQVSEIVVATDYDICVREKRCKQDEVLNSYI